MVGWHKVLLQLRDRYADPAVNPREAFSVGAAQGAAVTPRASRCRRPVSRRSTR